VDDEVIVGFLESDPRFPVILGSLFSEKNKPPDEGDSTAHGGTIILGCPTVLIGG
jgi:uncharacterized protein involved in type VI secretion and phage assembly